MRTPPPPPGPAREFRLPRFRSRRPPGGPLLRAARWGGGPSVACAVVFPGAGSAHDPAGLDGMAEVTAEAFLGGTLRREARALAEAIDERGAILDVSAGFDAAIARLLVLADELEPGLALLAELLGEPAFPDEEVDLVRSRLLDLLSEQRSEPDFLCRERLLLELYPAHPYGRLAASEEALGTLRRDDVVRFHRRSYDLSRAAVVLVGDEEPERLLARAEAALSGLARAEGTEPSVPAPTPIGGLSFHLVPRPASSQANLLFARPALLRSDPRFPAAAAASQALGGGASSRLFHVLREERGLTYGAFCNVACRTLAGHFAAWLDCRTEAAAESLDGLLGLVSAFAAEGPTEEEHRLALRYLVGSFAVARETPGALAQDEVTRLLLGLPEDEWGTWRGRLLAVTREEAGAAAASFFAPDRGVVVAVGDPERLRPILEARGPTTVWEP